MDKSQHDNESCTQIHDFKIFQIEKKVYTWGDILASAEFRGLLKPHWDSVESGIACSQHALETENARDADLEPIRGIAVLIGSI